MMEKIYVVLIKKGLKTMEDVPEKIKDRVKKLLMEGKTNG